MKRLQLRWLDPGLLGLAMLVALALRLHRLGDQNVWWDEGYSVYLARKGLLALALETAGDVHPPLHYWLLHFWVRLAGESELAVRYSSVWFAVASVPLVYWLGRRTLGRGVGVVAAWLLATSRFHVEWSQQIRMYTLVAALSVLSIALTLGLWEKPRSRLWVAYVAVTTASLYTLYLSGLVPLVESLATGLLLLLPIGGRRLSPGFVVRWVGAQLLCLALFAPWAALFLSTTRATPKLIYPIDLRTFLHASATAFPLGISAYLERYTPATLAALGLLALAIPAIARRPRQRLGTLLYALVLVPPGVVYALSFPNPVLYAPNLSVRYLLIFLPAYHLLMAAAVVFLWQPTKEWPFATHADPRTAAEWTGAGHGPGGSGRAPVLVASALRALPGALAAVFVAGIVIWSLADYYPGRRLVDDCQTVVGYLKAHARPGDAVVLNSDRDWPIFLYYYAGGLPRYGVGSLQPISPAGAAELLEPILAKHGSLWLLTSDNAYDSDPAGHVPAWLGKHARPVREIAGPRRKLALYSTDSSRSVGAPAVVRPDRVTSAAFDGGLSILGYDLAVHEVAPGEDLRLAVYWRLPGALSGDTHAALRLLDSRGVVYRDFRAPLSAARPPDRWQPGQVVRADYVLPVPKAMLAGAYSLALGVVAGERDLPLSGATGVSARLRTVRVVGDNAHAPAHPAPQRPTDFSLGGRIRLSGFDLALAPDRPLSSGVPARGDLTPGTVLRLRLHWEVLQAVDRPYTVFVQLVGQATNPATGNPVWAQRDIYPQEGRRPTDGWVPGEVVLDDYELTVPPRAPSGPYYLQVGLYDVGTGRRLPVASRDKPAGDSIIVFEGQVVQ